MARRIQGFEKKCKAANISPSNMTLENRKKVGGVLPIFEDYDSDDFRIEYCIAMDLETCSLADTGG